MLFPFRIYINLVVDILNRSASFMACHVSVNFCGFFVLFQKDIFWYMISDHIVVLY